VEKPGRSGKILGGFRYFQAAAARRALRYRVKGACRSQASVCSANLRNFEALEMIVKKINAEQLSALTCLGGAWSSA
jgi:hypothetical protein